MKKVIMGVYKITNIETGEMYIGCSTNIYNRWSNHKTRYKNEKSKEYSKGLYSNMRKYGIDSFCFEVLEETTFEELLLKEKEYIYLNDSIQNGYNNSNCQEDHGRALLCNEDIVDIRTRYSLHETKRNVYFEYSDVISKSGFHKIWNGYNWKKIMPEVFNDENKHFHKFNCGNPGENNGRTKLTDCDVICIRNMKKDNKELNEVFELYKGRISKESFRNVWHEYNWKHIVI